MWVQFGMGDLHAIPLKGADTCCCLSLSLPASLQHWKHLTSEPRGLRTWFVVRKYLPEDVPVWVVFFPSLIPSRQYRIIIILLPLALQPTVGFGLSNNVLPFFFLSATNSLHLLTPSTWRSLSTSSFHIFLGLPLHLVPSSSWEIFLSILSSSILSTWPNQLILCLFIHFTIISPSSISSSSRFFQLFHSLFHI